LTDSARLFAGVMTLTLWVGSRMALEGELALSFLVAFINLALLMANGLGQASAGVRKIKLTLSVQVTGALPSIAKAVGASESIFKILDRIPRSVATECQPWRGCSLPNIQSESNTSAASECSTSRDWLNSEMSPSRTRARQRRFVVCVARVSQCLSDKLYPTFMLNSCD
jgi:ABC-type multidrug transport system fused ATPase/permease subunit